MLKHGVSGDIIGTTNAGEKVLVEVQQKKDSRKAVNWVLPRVRLKGLPREKPKVKKPNAPKPTEKNAKWQRACVKTASLWTLLSAGQVFLKKKSKACNLHSISPTF